MNEHRIGFIGGGNMAGSLIQGLIESGYNPQKIWVSDRNPDKRKRLEQLGVQTYESDDALFESLDIIVLAVKPNDIKTIAETQRARIQHSKLLLISIAAGITSSQLYKWFGKHLAIIRGMPNTPALLRAGATGLYATSSVSEAQKELAESIMRSVGIAVWVDHEHEIDTITALSGSGPAYFFYVMEALQQTAQELGLPVATAKILTLQTALGAARMALESDTTLKELIKRVVSKGGTTEKALTVLESGGTRAIFKKAVEEAKNRSREISEQFDRE
jgi:pyrroline-5-carboxylate reductase